MKKIKIAKKRVMMDIITMSMLILAGVLIFLMHKYMGDVEAVYIPEEKVYGMPLHIGFRWSVALGMLGVILIQVVMYVWSYCKKGERILILMSSIWLDTVIIFDSVSDISKNKWFFILRDDLKCRNLNTFFSIWDDINSFEVLVVVVIGVIYLTYWLLGVNIEDSKITRLLHYLSVICIVAGIVLLALESYCAPWYFVTCAFTSVISWIVLRKIEKICEPYMDEEMADTVLYTCIEPLLDFFMENQDDDMEEIDEITEEIGRNEDNELKIYNGDKNNTSE